MNGRRDDYSRLDTGQRVADRKGVSGDVTTRAKGEGFLEGIAADYKMRSNFDTAFKYSRFDATAAPPRNVSALGGDVELRHAHPHPGREHGRQ